MDQPVLSEEQSAKVRAIAEKIKARREQEQRGHRRYLAGGTILVIASCAAFFYYGNDIKLGLPGIDYVPTTNDAEPSKRTVEPTAAICSGMRAAGATQCEVFAFGQRVDVTLNMTPAEAAKSCVGAAAEIRAQLPSFGDGWELRIFSPFGDRPIAACSIQ